ncbi:hypothetical protein AHF37_10474 [Paragonimus kellicotti]|nr:hypothetical protein AHF37_10474 [Paragonimus kellicotti]
MEVRHVGRRRTAPLYGATVINRLSLLNVSFNASEILIEPSIALSGLTELFGLNMTQLIEQFDKLENDLRERANTISSKIQNELNLQTQFQSLLSIWDTVRVNVTQPVISQLNVLQPTVESSSGILVFGYVNRKTSFNWAW